MTPAIEKAPIATTATFSPILCAELAKLDDAAILTLLGEIVEPSIHTPFATSEAFDDALTPVTDAYRDAYDHLVNAVNWGGVECLACGHDCYGACDAAYDAGCLAPVTRISPNMVAA